MGAAGGAAYVTAQFLHRVSAGFFSFTWRIVEGLSPACIPYRTRLALPKMGYRMGWLSS